MTSREFSQKFLEFFSPRQREKQREKNASLFRGGFSRCFFCPAFFGSFAMSEIIDAIMHAVRAAQRRADGLPRVADLHSAASRRYLAKAVAR